MSSKTTYRQWLIWKTQDAIWCVCEYSYTSGYGFYETRGEYPSGAEAIAAFARGGRRPTHGTHLRIPLGVWLDGDRMSPAKRIEPQA